MLLVQTMYFSICVTWNLFTSFFSLLIFHLHLSNYWNKLNIFWNKSVLNIKRATLIWLCLCKFLIKHNLLLFLLSLLSSSLASSLLSLPYYYCRIIVKPILGRCLASSFLFLLLILSVLVENHACKSFSVFLFFLW